MKNLIIFFFKSSYFKFGLLVGCTYVLELILFYFLTLKFHIFISNFIASIFGVSLDYFLATSEKLNIFKKKAKNKYLIYIIYLIFIFLLISFNSTLITFINEFISIPVISKILIIPISYTINWSFFYLVFTRSKLS